MTLRHMKIFEAVFRHSNITKAAEELHLAQPSVSVAVRELEEYYGICLFERLGRRIVPTELGKEFYGYALHIVSLFDEMEQKIRNWDALGVIRIGASITIGTHILPPLLKQYQALYPELRTEVTIGKSAVIEQHILENKIDIGLIENQSEHPDINVLPFMEDYMQAVVAPDHPLAGCSQVTLEQLAQYHFLMRRREAQGARSWTPALPWSRSPCIRSGRAPAPRRSSGALQKGWESPSCPAFWSGKILRNIP